jgi:predicted nucleotidyltransferase
MHSGRSLAGHRVLTRRWIAYIPSCLRNFLIHNHVPKSEQRRTGKVCHADRYRVFEEAQSVIRTFLREIDAQTPGLVTDVYITGSIALGEARPGRSDVDIVLVRPDDTDDGIVIDALGPILTSLRKTHPRPPLDGIVLSRSDLAHGPDEVKGNRAVIFENRVQLSNQGSARNPVTWQTLRQCGVTWRGVPIAESDLWQDAERLRSWTHQNLEEYWRPWLAKSDRLFSNGGMWSLRPDFTEWGVLGVTRLHATITTGSILSKHGAGVYALETFPQRWHRVVHEAMRILEGDREVSPLYRNPLVRRNDGRAFISMVIEDARRMADG